MIRVNELGYDCLVTNDDLPYLMTFDGAIAIDCAGAGEGAAHMLIVWGWDGLMKWLSTYWYYDESYWPQADDTEGYSPSEEEVLERFMTNGRWVLNLADKPARWILHDEVFDRTELIVTLVPKHMTWLGE